MGKRYKLNVDELVLASDDDETFDDEEAIETYLNEVFETGFLDPDTGITLYKENGVISVEEVKD